MNRSVKMGTLVGVGRIIKKKNLGKKKNLDIGG